MSNKIALYLYTVKYLRFSQIFYRLKNKVIRFCYLKKLFRIYLPKEIITNDRFDFLISELDLSQEFLNRFNVNDILNDVFKFINLSHQVNMSISWNNKNLQHLWRYNLHYFDYLLALANEYIKNNNLNCYIKAKYFIDGWIDNNTFAYGDGWHPYTISLRITNWIMAYQIFKKPIKEDKVFDERLKESIYTQYIYLLRMQEKDVLGNHYFENIKALIISSIFFNDIKTKKIMEKELLKQLSCQIMEDGLHFELSIMYHDLILEDLIKIAFWLKEEAVFNQLIPYIQKMLDVSYSFNSSLARIPAFNDSSYGISKDYISLLNACKKCFCLTPVKRHIFESSGYYIINDNLKKIIFDTGDICPSYLPAHGHCDALSFELYVHGFPYIVNSGTYMYQAGELRDYFRSTKAHNTVSIRENEQSQFWGSFRIANRVKNIWRKQFTYKNIAFYAGRYTSFKGDTHKRYMGNIDDNAVIVIDYVFSTNRSKSKSYLHFYPESDVKIDNNNVFVTYNNVSLKIVCINASELSIEQGWYSEQFNLKEPNSVLVITKDINFDYSGYLIEICSNNINIVSSKAKLCLKGSEEIVLNIDELRDMI